jgi:Zn-dependent peptidase ImmA (M78 family)
MPSAARPSVDELASQLLAEQGIKTIPVAVDKIAKALGAQLRYSPLDEELAGMVFVKGGVPIIGVNSLHHPNRQRFTIAHEIAHLRLHRDEITRAVHVDKGFGEPMLKRDAASATGTERLEIDANQFAAALLMPRSILEDILAGQSVDIEDERSLEDLAKRFRVSRATLQYRIRNLANDSSARRLA